MSKIIEANNKDDIIVKEIVYDESFNDFTDSADGGLIIDLEKFIKTALLQQKSILITKIKSLS